MTTLNELSATEIVRNIRERRAKPSDVMEAHLERIAGREMDVGAFQYLDENAALALARDADSQPPRGPLHKPLPKTRRCKLPSPFR